MKECLKSNYNPKMKVERQQSSHVTIKNVCRTSQGKPREVQTLLVRLASKVILHTWNKSNKMIYVSYYMESFVFKKLSSRKWQKIKMNEMFVFTHPNWEVLFRIIASSFFNGSEMKIYERGERKSLVPRGLKPARLHGDQ